MQARHTVIRAGAPTRYRAGVSGPQDLAEVENVPHGRTARRLEWQHLPPAVRALVEQRLGSPVAKADSQGSGFTPGFASRLTGEDGSRLFVKAASKKAQAPFAESYAEEVRKLGLVPAGLPVPRLLWHHEDDLCWAAGPSTAAHRDDPGSGPSSPPAWTPWPRSPRR